MITVEQSLELIRKHIPPPGFETIPLAESLGRILAEDAFSDADLPPFNKSLMDGYAVRSADIRLPPVELEVLEIVAAGAMPTREVKPGKAIRIMTGAPVPDGADAIIMDEQTEYQPATRTVRCLNTVEPKSNIGFKSEDIENGARAVSRDTKITSQVIGLLAAIGRVKVQVYKYPSVSVAATGNELVEIGMKTEGAQIRASNAYAIQAQLAKSGIKAALLGIIRDDAESMSARISEGLKSDMLILTGGISHGDYDLTKDALKKLGVNILFDRVAGKAFVFGVGSKGQLVFGLSGNPVAAFIGVEIFVKEALSLWVNDRSVKNRMSKAVLAVPIGGSPGYGRFLAGRFLPDGRLEPISGRGAAGLVSLARAEGLIMLPADGPDLPAGSSVDLMLF